MRFAFQHKLDISSYWVILHRLAILSEIEPVWYDCCVNSCLAYTGEYEALDCCPDCNATRFNDNGKPRRKFCYLPLIPRLQGYFQNPRMIERLSYRHSYQYDPNNISDIFDSLHYQTLLKETVFVDGKPLDHSFFSDQHDIAVSVCFDGYLLYNRRRSGPSATPILLQNYNLHPSIRTHMSMLICLGVVPGPKGPRRLGSFLFPFDEECVRLAFGVPTFNCAAQEEFLLHAYNIFGLGDILAIEKFLRLKGHNGITPCRSCEIKAIHDPSIPESTYYVPLAHPKIPGQKLRSWDPSSLPMRMHKTWDQVVTKIESAQYKYEKEKIAKHYGIKGRPALQRMSSLDYARGFPWEFMHLFLENLTKNLINLWTGKFKGLDVGSEDYEIAPAVWEEIGRETAAAVKDIPADFVRALGNIADERSTYNAEALSFWFIYLAPILLEGRFKNPKYHTHLCELAEIMKICLQFSISHEEIDELEKKIITWVQTYEK